MTDEQRRGIAAGFLHVLSTTPSVFEAWLATPKDDAAAICALVARSLGLAEVPTTEDLHAMAQHIDEMLQGRAEELIEGDSRVPRHVGFIAYMHHRADAVVNADSRVPRHVGFVGLMQNRADGEIDDVQLRELLEISRLTAAR